jgi:hypothetical protein
VCDQETSKTRRLKARYRAVKIQPQWVVTPGKQTNKQKTNKQTNKQKQTKNKQKTNKQTNKQKTNKQTKNYSFN